MICENIQMFDSVRRLTGTTLATSKFADLYLLSALVSVRAKLVTCQTFGILAELNIQPDRHFSSSWTESHRPTAKRRESFR